MEIVSSYASPETMPAGTPVVVVSCGPSIVGEGGYVDYL